MNLDLIAQDVTLAHLRILIKLSIVRPFEIRVINMITHYIN